MVGDECFLEVGAGIAIVSKTRDILRRSGSGISLFQLVEWSGVLCLGAEGVDAEIP